MENTISIKEFRRIVKENGYKLKVESLSCMGDVHKYMSILDKEGNFIVGSGANVYGKETFEKHKIAFELVQKFKGRVIDENGEKVRGF